MKQKGFPAVSYQSTKQELWSAYKQLKQLVEERDKEKPPYPPTAKGQAD